jgi:DNA-binding transcriptional ArsR family regulator
MSAEARRDVFQAIADPTRRDIIGLLVKRPQNLNTIAKRFAISRPAISKHVKILSECGLLVIRQQGRERYCEAKLNKLRDVSAWVDQYRKFWDNKLDALEKFLNESAKQKKLTQKSTKSKKQRL